mgnify:CR=1 FL=1
MRVRYIRTAMTDYSWTKEVSIPAMRVRYITSANMGINSQMRFNSRYAGKIHQQKQRKTLPLTMASLCKTLFLLFIVYHICLHLSTFYPKFHRFCFDFSPQVGADLFFFEPIL